MSSRNFRKICGNSLPPPDSDDSDAEYDPLASQHHQKSTYEGLVVSSDSESCREPEVEDDDEEEDACGASNVVQGGARKKKPAKKGKGKGKKGRLTGDAAGDGTVGTSGTSSSRRALRLYNTRGHGEELDEIDKSLMEVNALLGEPPPAPVVPKEEYDEGKIILEVKPKHLNVATELRKLFGPDDPEEVRQRNKSQPHRLRVLKRVMVGPTHDTAIYEFKKMGLSMSIEKREGNVIHFVYDHDADHQKMHNAFLVRYAKNFLRQGTALLNMDDARKFMHVEPLLEIADTLFRMDENSLANEIIENVITYLQFVAHPSFNLSSSNVRLSYNYIENRPFHVAMLKYMYLLTNKACHRTALEIAKMLLNIDPCDPLAVLFVIDTLAIRAREHQWLIDAIEFFNKQRQAKMLFNIQYSFALAHFHVATKSKKDLSEADKHLQNAIMSYPRVVYRVLEFASVNDPAIMTHNLYTHEPQSHSGEGLSELMLIYAKLTWSRWREPQVMEWFIRNAKEVIAQYDQSHDVRERVSELENLRHNIFQVWPTEIMRHVSIIRSMSNLLLETTLNPSTRPTSSWDPLFDRGVNRYVQWNEHSFLMAHLIGSGGRTQHASAFDPWQGIGQRADMPNNRNRALRAASPSPARSNGPSAPTNQNPSNDPTPQVNESAVDVYRPNLLHAHQLEGFLNPQRLNGIVPERMYHQNAPVYALNFLHMFHEVLQLPNNADNATVNNIADESLEESELDDLPEENAEIPLEGNDKN